MVEVDYHPGTPAAAVDAEICLDDPARATQPTVAAYQVGTDAS